MISNIFDLWFSCLGNGIGFDLFNYGYSFNDHLRSKDFNTEDSGKIETRVNELYDKEFIFSAEEERPLTIREFIGRYEGTVRDRRDRNWEYLPNLVKSKLPSHDEFNLETNSGPYNVVLLLMGYTDSKYAPHRLNGVLETRLSEDDEGVIKKGYFDRLKKSDFSFLEEVDKVDLVLKLKAAQELMLKLITAEMMQIRGIYGLKSYNTLLVKDKLRYKEEVKSLVKPNMSCYGSEFKKRFREECDKFNSKNNSRMRESLSSEIVSALFWNKKREDNSPLLSLSGRIKQLQRIIYKLAFKSVDYLGSLEPLRIDDMIISDIMGIMKLYDPRRNMSNIADLYYKSEDKPYWITMEDKPYKEKEGHQRQTKLIHSSNGIVLDLHERDPRGLFFCHFGPNSQYIYETSKYNRLPAWKKALMKDYKKALKQFFSQGFEFKEMG